MNAYELGFVVGMQKTAGSAGMQKSIRAIKSMLRGLRDKPHTVGAWDAPNIAANLGDDAAAILEKVKALKSRLQHGARSAISKGKAQGELARKSYRQWGDFVFSPDLDNSSPLGRLVREVTTGRQ